MSQHKNSARIAFIIQRFGTIHRGAEHFILELVQSFPPEQQSLIDIITLTEKGKPQKSVHPAFNVIAFPLSRYLFRENFDFLFRSRIVRKIFSFFHITGGSGIEGFFLYRQGRKKLTRKYSHVFPVGGFWTFQLAKKIINIKEEKGKIIGVAQAAYYREDFLESDKYIALTPSVFRTALKERRQLQQQKNNSGKKIFLIPNGLNKNKFLEPSWSVAKSKSSSFSRDQAGTKSGIDEAPQAKEKEPQAEITAEKKNHHPICGGSHRR